MEVSTSASSHKNEFPKAAEDNNFSKILFRNF
jgi:hypothetical protein